MTRQKIYGILCKVESFTYKGGNTMSAKNMRYSLLLDFYGELLPSAQRDMIDLYYNEDLSLSEIAEQVGITRQGVRDSVRRAEDLLSDYEEKLGMAGRFARLSEVEDLLHKIKDTSSENEVKLLSEIALSTIRTMQ